MYQKRINRFDNLKGIFIVFVVLFHVLQRSSFIQNDSLTLPDYILSCVGCFLMPAFTFISGLFTSKARRAGDDEKLVSNILIPFLIAHLLQWVIFSRSLKSVFTPSLSTWYLLSLFFWRILVAPVSRIRFSFFISILVGLVCGFTAANNLLSVSRAVSFFPYFLAGYFTDRNRLLKLGNTCARKITGGVGLLVVFLIAILLHYHGFPIKKILYLNASYSSLGLSDTTGLLLRALAYCMGFASIICLFSLMPDIKCFLTDLGKNTMPVYIGHAFIVRANPIILKRFNIFSNMSEAGFLLFSVLVTAAICLLLSNRYVIRVYQFIMNHVILFCFDKMKKGKV